MKALFLAAAAIGAVLPAAAQAATIYQNDFESGAAGSAISGFTTVTTAPLGQKFLGTLALGATSTLTLNTAGLTSITLGFDLYTIGSLDGTGVDFCCGPDVFRLGYTSGTTSGTLINDTFSNWDTAGSFNGPWHQSFGGNGSIVNARTGENAALRHQLGTEYYGEDATYNLSYVIPVTGDTTTINFVGAASQDAGDEGFGIDNILVTAVAPIPEPATWATMLVGFGVVGTSMRRRPRGMLAASAV